MGVDSLPKTVTRQRRDGDMNPGPSAPESSTLTARLPKGVVCCRNNIACLLSVFPRAYVRNYRAYSRLRQVCVHATYTAVAQSSSGVVAILCADPRNLHDKRLSGQFQHWQPISHVSHFVADAFVTRRVTTFIFNLWVNAAHLSLANNVCTKFWVES